VAEEGRGGCEEINIGEGSIRAMVWGDMGGTLDGESYHGAGLVVATMKSFLDFPRGTGRQVHVGVCFSLPVSLHTNAPTWRPGPRLPCTNAWTMNGSVDGQRRRLWLRRQPPAPITTPPTMTTTTTGVALRCWRAVVPRGP
jgi:hypothetical protein